MKKVLIALFIGMTSLFHSQCITGGPDINLNQTVTFTSGNVAQCANCYDWDINGDTTSSDNQTVGTIQIVGSDQGQSVSILGVAPGPFSLSVTYFTENGCQECRRIFSGVVIDNSCEFTLSNISTTVGTGSVTFQTSPTPSITSGITYTWTATYEDGSTSVIVVNNSGMVTFPATGANPLVSVCVTANYLTCSDTKCLTSTTMPCALPASFNMSIQKMSTNGPVMLTVLAAWFSNYTYTWTATYSDQSTITTYGPSSATNQFPGCNNGANLISVTLRLCSPVCCKTYTVLNTINWCGSGGPLRTYIQNPIKERLLLDTINMEKFNGVIYDLNGNKVMEFNQTDLPSKDISKLAKKLHIIKIFNDKNEEVYSDKILVE